MKHISKNEKNEPLTLKNYRETTPNATYKGFVDTEQKLKTALCHEQGFICCYCMRPIAPTKMSVEHYMTQKHHKDSPHTPDFHKKQDLSFTNMLGSCNDEARNCSGIRGNTPLSIDPRNKLIESQIKFFANGVIAAVNNDEIVLEDLKTLRLGIESQPPHENFEYTLVKNRAFVIDGVRKILDKKGWTKTILEKEIDKWQTPNTEGYLQEYCQVAIFYLRKKLKTLS